MATHEAMRDDQRDVARQMPENDDPARAAIEDVQRAVLEPDRPLGIGDIEAVGVGGLSGDGGHPLAPLTGAAAVDPDDPRRRVAEGPLGAQVPDDELPEARRD